MIENPHIQPQTEAHVFLILFFVFLQNLKLFRTEITKEFNGRKNVADFVKTGGETYNYLFNCHVASGLMMLQ